NDTVRISVKLLWRDHPPPDVKVAMLFKGKLDPSFVAIFIDEILPGSRDIRHSGPGPKNVDVGFSFIFLAQPDTRFRVIQVNFTKPEEVPGHFLVAASRSVFMLDSGVYKLAEVVA